MKIKVALLDKDKEYLDRLTGVFNTKYADKLEVYSFTDEKKRNRIGKRIQNRCINS